MSKTAIANELSIFSDESEGVNLRYSLQKSGNVDPVEGLLNLLLSKGKIREMDRAFALFVSQRLDVLSASLSLAAEDKLFLVAFSALTSEQLSRQHVCLEVSQLGTVLQPWRPYFHFPESHYCRQLLSSEAFVALGLMVFDGERLYLQRYWQYEQQVVKSLTSFSGPRFRHENIINCIENLYQEDSRSASAGEPDWQKNAIALACLKSVTVIAGGPGTGKTTTVVRILWSLSKLYQQMKNNGVIIKMVAPTGKAAARLSESVSGAIEKLPGGGKDSATAIIPKQCSTIHRLLGVIPGSVFFKHNEQRPLNIDVLVVDEASMIDLPLLAKLLNALPSHCRVILLGDSHQLASVEVGSVFSDICRLKQGSNRFSMETCQSLQRITNQPMSTYARETQTVEDFSDSILFLTKSWRFHANSGIGQLARAVNGGDVAGTFEVLHSKRADLAWHSLITEEHLLNMVLPHFISLHEAALNEDMQLGFKLLSQIQILTVQRSGKWGLQHINGLVKQALVKQGLITVDQEFYPGRPIMISSNDYQNRLFNGDVGLVIVDNQTLQQTGRTVFKVCFQDAEKGFRTLLPAQLPEHDTMFAMTTHKSQGSEFAKVIFCLPDNQGGSTELLNRELLYTGITRARSDFVLFANEGVVTQTVKRVCKRASGLASVLAQHKL